MTLATGGAILTGAAVAQPAALLDLDAVGGPMDLFDHGAADHAGLAAATTLPPRHHRVGTRTVGDRRELAARGPVVSRSEDRLDRDAVDAPAPAAMTAVEALSRVPGGVRSGTSTLHKRWTTASLNLWAAYGRHSAKIGEIGRNKVVLATGRSDSGRDQIVTGGRVAWVTSGYLSTKPVPETPAPTTGSSSTSSGAASGSTDAGLDFSACGDSSVEDGITDGAVKVYRAVCNAFPEVASGTTYGYDPHGEHSSGKALDFMIDGDVDLGYRIRDFVQAHAAELDIYDIIYRQHIWTPVRASEGWRLMEDRGDPTANHMDHVHVSVN